MKLATIQHLVVLLLFLAFFCCVSGVVIGVPQRFFRTPQDSLLPTLRRAGFWEAVIDSTRSDTIWVSLGRSAVVETLYILHSDSVQTEFEKLLFIQPGDTVNSESVFAQQESFVNALENCGYPFASCTTAVVIRERTDRIGVVLSFVIEEGIFVTLEQLDAQIDGRTKPSVIAHLMLFQPGKPYRQQDVDLGVQRLRQAGIVSLSGQPYPALSPDGKWTLVVKGEDLPTTSISGVLGYTDNVLSGDLELSAKNILGTGRCATFSISASESDREVKLSYSEPFIGKLNISPKFSSVWEIRDSTYSSREHKLGINFPLSFRTEGYIGFLAGRTVPGVAGATVSQSESFGIEAALRFSSLDIPMLPSKGILFNSSITGEYLHRWGYESSQEPGSRGSASFLVAVPAEKWLSLWLRTTEWGWIMPTFPPKSDWEYLGGWQNLRGYREDQFSGCRLVWATVEPRIIIQNKAHIFPFVDIGAYRDEKKWNAKASYGAGIEYIFGAAVFSIEYAIGEGRTATNGLVHFGMRMNM